MRVYRLRGSLGEPLQLGHPFFDGLYYRPAEYLASASDEELDAAGVDVTDEPEAERPIYAVRGERIAQAWSYMNRLIEAGSVVVETSVGPHSFGLDKTTQDNLQKAVLAVLMGIAPPQRPWTPKGASASILITPTDVVTITGAVGMAYEGYVQAYLAHKRAITALTTAADVDAYDLAAGWPS